MKITDNMVELAARNILRADGVSYIEIDSEWLDDVRRYREMCAKFPDYASARSLIADAFRRARAALSAALAAAEQPVAWLPAEGAPRGVKALIRHRSGQMDVAYKTDNGEPFLETWRYAGTARHGEQAPWPDNYLPISALASPAQPAPSQDTGADRQIERLAVLRKLGDDHGGENEKAPDQASVDAAIAFIRRWGLPDNAITTLSDDGFAVIELHGDSYADITFRPSPTDAAELAEAQREARKAAIEECEQTIEPWTRRQELLLRCGEMSKQEMRTSLAVSNGIMRAIRALAEDAHA